MAITPAGAWVWSGVPMTTASILWCISSSILRKSLYRLASGYSSKVCAARFSSTSHKATMFSLAAPFTSAAPRPPTPIPAMFNFSLAWVPRTNRLSDRMMRPALHAKASCATLRRKSRRLNCFCIGLYSFSSQRMSSINSYTVPFALC